MLMLAGLLFSIALLFIDRKKGTGLSLPTNEAQSAADEKLGQ